MNYWWVNQKQTHRQEIGDGYMWSPKRQSDGNKNFSYEYMKRILPGDVIYSYANALIIAVGIAETHCYSFPKPIEFGQAGSNWSDEGWKINVKYRQLNKPVRTMDYLSHLTPFLPEKYSPISSKNGQANQSYLFQISKPLALAIAELIDRQIVDLVNCDYINDDLIIPNTIDRYIEDWEDQIQLQLESSTDIDETEKEVLIKSRRGQGKFRSLLLIREPRCRVTGVNKPEHLIASHIKPWRSASNEERLDPENGFMLTPTIDHLFDKGFIAFENDGSVILADVADRESMKKMGVVGVDTPNRLPALASGKKNYLEWHRESIFLG